MAENKLSVLTILLWNVNGIFNNTDKLQLVPAEKNIDVTLILFAAQNFKFWVLTVFKPIILMTQPTQMPSY